jgi:predicted acylesterase/phospholipase RssA
MIGKEVGFINLRKHRADTVECNETGPGSKPLNVVALALSGGGIRSASFSLGVVQAFNEHRVFNSFDYLSTVSGGGYLGASISATMNKTGGEFVFGESTQTQTSDVKDTDSVAHLRNYSNYLIPRGGRDLITAAAIIFRGLVANAALILPFVLFAAALIILNNPKRGNLLEPDIFGFKLIWLPVNNFGVTLLFFLITLVLFLLWAVIRSFLKKQSEFGSWPPTFGAACVVLIALTCFIELQPYVLDGMFSLLERSEGAGVGDTLLASFVHNLAAIATPVAAAVTFFRQQIGTLLKSVTSASSITTKALALVGEAAIWIAGAAVPLLIWIGFLYLCFWGIRYEAKSVEQQKQPVAVHGTIQITGPGLKLEGSLDCRQAPKDSRCADILPEPSKKIGPCDHTPMWLRGTANLLKAAADPEMKCPVEGSIPALYVISGIILFFVSFLLTPNANSLHRLYRDRLSKAFLFDPTYTKVAKAAHDAGGKAYATVTGTSKDKDKDKDKEAYAKAKADQAAAKAKVAASDDTDQGRDFVPLDTMEISELVEDGVFGPYHLINAALNIQGSDFANRRGRNADFFLFSPAFVGSVATGYCDTKEMQAETNLDLATAMAVSGAAFSSNMGANSIRALTATLAILNIRTGYWLKNPRAITNKADPSRHARLKSTRWYLWRELTGQLRENGAEVYLTDGGHIENLGIYELLRRRCKVIVAVDAEADPAMRFPSFVTLQRYARIDLGIRIWMPWDQIRSDTIAAMGADGSAPAVDPPQDRSGPHAAIGKIEYDGKHEGWLLYIKSSLTGDENDSVRDYARRYSSFPHETTGDQFFSEEQFEAYRALGFHIAARLLKGQDRMQVYDADNLLHIGSDNKAVKAVREALFRASA